MAEEEEEREGGGQGQGQGEMRPVERSGDEDLIENLEEGDERMGMKKGVQS